MTFRTLLLAAVAALWPSTGFAAAFAADDAQDRIAARALAVQLKTAKLDESERRDVQDQMLELGEVGAIELREILIERRVQSEAEFRERAKPYFRSFGRRAKKVIARAQRGKKNEIETLQDTLRRLRNRSGLSKSEIVATGDPALDRLVELTWMSPEDIVGQDEALAEDREALVAIGIAVEDDAAFLEVCEWQLESADIRSGIFDDEQGEGGIDAEKEPPFNARAELDRGESWELALATPMSKSNAKVLIKNHKLADQIEAQELLGVRALNLLRIRLGLPPISIDVRLCFAARDHSTDMATLGFFDHTSPVPGKRTPSQRAARFKTSGGAENIAAGQETGAGAIRAWWHSPGHHKNMLGGHGRVGMGQFKSLWTQMFG